MSGLTQIIRNLYIRLEGLLYQFFGLIKNIFSQVFGFLGRIFGFSNSGYFLETNDATSIKSSQNKQVTEPEPKTTPEPSPTARRRPDPKMDYFRKMAQEVNKTS
ncbi:threonine dehydratase [Mastigocladus laminosus UU774]|nr:MAG: threonine dehydratase [Hapalosiphonaceae cyanobacterium JJU2]TBR60425.1 threonine dehydratase [Westiellopsis prolifica IICB1]TFI55239.1 threonine dehydratase [Mastigocladus laminosus UU774]